MKRLLIHWNDCIIEDQHFVIDFLVRFLYLIPNADKYVIHLASIEYNKTVLIDKLEWLNPQDESLH